MGRYYYGEGKNSVEDYKRIDIKTFKKDGFIEEGVNHRKGTFSWSRNGEKNGSIGVEITKGETTGTLRVYFMQTSYNGEKQDLDYKIPLVATPCNYGGVRWWFLCPCKGNRCSVLYLQNNGIFASRKTLDLCYPEQKESKKYRILGYLMGDAFTKIELIRRTMKYPFRNGKPTKKMKRILKLKQKMPSLEEVKNINTLLQWN